MILLTGATGQLGTSILRSLVEQVSAAGIAAFARDDTKAAPLRAQGLRVHIGDYDDPASLVRAMEGIDRVLLIAGTDEHNRLRHHQNVIQAAVQVGVGGIAYTGRALHDPATLQNRLMAAHFQTEDLIRASGLPYTLFRNALYLDTIPLFMGKDALTAGIHLAAGMGRVAYALRAEIAEALANWLATGSCQNDILTLTGSAAYSYADVAAALSALTGKEVSYKPIDDDAYLARMIAQGAPERMAQVVLGFLRDIRNGQEETVTADLETLLGRAPASLEAGLKWLLSL
jgi:NAD(P)H dehydrogenase (quinone)